MATDNVLTIPPALEREPTGSAVTPAESTVVSGLRGYLDRCHAAGREVLSEDIGILGLAAGAILAISRRFNAQPMRETIRLGVITIYPPESFTTLDAESRAALFNTVDDVTQLGSLLELEVSGG